MGRKPNAATVNKAELSTESSNLASKKQSLTVTRRSGRLRNQNPPPQNLEIEPVVEINVSEDEMEYETNADEDPVVGEKSLEEKIDYIIQAVDELKSKDSRRYQQDDVPMTDLTYKSLYFDSQKKIETLMKENYELSKKAEIALGKMEAHGEATRVWSEVLIQVKDMFKFANLPKDTLKVNKLPFPTNVENLSSPSNVIGEANGAVETQPGGKRKKKAKTNKNNEDVILSI